MDRKNKFLMLIIIFLIIGIGIVSYFAYQNYQMGIMDAHMKQSNIYADQASDLWNEASILVNQSKIDEAKSKIEEANGIYKKAIDEAQAGMNNAPNQDYKDLIGLGIKYQNVYLEIQQSWLQRLINYQSGDYSANVKLNAQESTRINNFNEYRDDFEAFKTHHPGMQEHIDKYWLP